MGDRNSICQQSGRQHGKSRTLVSIALTDPQLTADPFDHRTILMPSPVQAAGSNPSDKTGPLLETDRA